jgi:protein-S-isoprenylcysteine O-methyltransferase Ste14
MSSINTGRVVAGGLAAGLVANVCDFVFNAFLLFDDMDLMRQRLNIGVATWESNTALVTWIVADFVLGLLLVFTYASMRPRFGPGPWTAITAALVLFLAITAVIFGFAQMGIFTTALVIKAGAFSLVTMSLASLAGAYIYRE